MRVINVDTERREEYIIMWVALEDALIDVLKNGTLVLKFKKLTKDDMTNVFLQAIGFDNNDILSLNIVLNNNDWVKDIVAGKLSLQIKRYDNAEDEASRIEIEVNKMISLTVGSKEDMPLDLCKHRIEELKKEFPKDSVIDIVYVKSDKEVKKPKKNKSKAKVSISDNGRHITLKELGDLKDVNVDSRMGSEYLHSLPTNDPFQRYDYDHISHLYLVFENATILINYSGNSRTYLASPMPIILDSLKSIGSEVVTMHNYDGYLNIYFKFNEYIKIKMKIVNYYGSDVKRTNVLGYHECNTPGIYIFDHAKED